LQVFRQDDAPQLDAAEPALLLDWYTDAMGQALRAAARLARGEAPGNSYGDSVAELALTLVYELQARDGFWHALLAVLAPGDLALEAVARKKFNDMYAMLRDKVDADSYQAATGRPCSANKIYTYRMLDKAYRAIAQVFSDWQRHAAQIAVILGREADGIPIEVRQMKSIAGCRAEWVIRWSAAQERFGEGPGPLHTRSKRFASLQNNPRKIAEMLAEIADYEELSSNQDDSWRYDASEAADWLDDYWRVAAESAAAGDEAGAARILPAPERDDGEGDEEDEEDNKPAALCAAPRYGMAAGIDAMQALRAAPLPLRLAVFQKILGASDDSYAQEWLDPETGELPTMQQLAVLGGMSVPTLRKRRNALIEQLLARVPQ
jgi:hypothetical protein